MGSNSTTDTNGTTTSWVDIGAFLLVLRITPFPPHWVCNVVAPHLGIGVLLFWATCFVGIAPVSLIHVTIGSGLDSMTSADDLHVLSVRNVLGLIAVVVAVMIPVGLKRVFKKDLGALGGEVEVEVGEVEEEEVDVVIADEGLRHGAGHGRLHEGCEVVYYDEEEGDVVIGEDGRYWAVDSGVELAGPSQGSEDVYVEPERAARKGSGKGKGRAGGDAIGKGKGQGKLRMRPVEIIADITEEEEEEEGEEWKGDILAPSMAISEKRRMRGYGAVEQSAPLLRPSERGVLG